MNNDEVNEAIKTLKKLCETTPNCDECPMYLNCYDAPSTWDEVEDNDVR